MERKGVFSKELRINKRLGPTLFITSLRSVGEINHGELHELYMLAVSPHFRSFFLQSLCGQLGQPHTRKLWQVQTTVVWRHCSLQTVIAIASTVKTNPLICLPKSNTRFKTILCLLKTKNCWQKTQSQPVHSRYKAIITQDVNKCKALYPGHSKKKKKIFIRAFLHCKDVNKQTCSQPALWDFSLSIMPLGRVRLQDFLCITRNACRIQPGKESTSVSSHAASIDWRFSHV